MGFDRRQDGMGWHGVLLVVFERLDRQIWLGTQTAINRLDGGPRIVAHMGMPKLDCVGCLSRDIKVRTSGFSPLS